MKLFFKIIVAIVILLIILIVAAALILRYAISPNYYKEKVSEIVFQQTGRTLTINGDAHLGLYPNLGLSLSDVTLSNPPGFGEPVFMHMDHLYVSMQLLPLLEKQIHINTLQLDGLTLPWLQVHLADVHFLAQNIEMDKAFPVSLTMHIDSEKPAFQGRLAVTAEATLMPELQRYELSHIALHLSGTEAAQLTGQLLLDLLKQELVLTAEVSSHQATLKTHLTVDQLQNQSPLTYRGDVQLLPVDLAHQTITAQVDFNGNTNAVTLNPIKATINQTAVTGQVSLTQFNPPALAFSLAVNRFNVADYANLQGADLWVDDFQSQGNLTANSWKMPDLTKTLNGKVQIEARQMTLRGLDLGAMLQQVNQALNQLLQDGDLIGGIVHLEQELPNLSPDMRLDPNSGKQTQFGYVNTYIMIKNGVAENPALNLNGSNQFAMDGQGSVDLNQKTVQYHLNAYTFQLQKQRDGQLTRIPDALQLPINIQGPFDHIQITMDQSALLGALHQKAAQQLKQKVLQRILGQ